MISVSTLIKNSIDLYKKHALTFFVYGILITVVSFVTTTLSTGVTIFGFDVRDIRDMLNLTSPLYYLTIFCILCISTILTAIITLVLTRVIHKTYMNQQVGSFAVELIDAKTLILPSIITGILTVLIILGGFLLLIVPGIIFSVWYVFATVAVAIDHKPVKEAFTYSKSLTMGRWFQVLWYILAPAFVFLLIEMIVSGIVHIPSLATPNNDIVTILVDLLDLGISIIIAPLYTIPLIILYDELKKNPITTEIPT